MSDAVELSSRTSRQWSGSVAGKGVASRCGVTFFGSTRVAIYASMLATIACCSSYDSARSAALIHQVLGRESESIRLQRPVAFSVVALNARRAEFQKGVMVQTDSQVAIFPLDSTVSSYEAVGRFPYTEIRAVGISSVGRRPQIQLVTSSRLLALNVSSDDGWLDQDAARYFLAFVKEKGVKEFTPRRSIEIPLSPRIPPILFVPH